MTCSFCYYQGFVCLYHLLFTNHRLCLERQGASHGFFGFKGHAQLLFTQSMWNISLTLSMAELQQTKTVAFHPIKAQKKTDKPVEATPMNEWTASATNAFQQKRANCTVGFTAKNLDKHNNQWNEATLIMVLVYFVIITQLPITEINAIIILWIIMVFIVSYFQRTVVIAGLKLSRSLCMRGSSSPLEQ